jgi:hypothetical protein
MQNLIATLADGRKISLVIPDGKDGEKAVSKMIERAEKNTPAPEKLASTVAPNAQRRRSDAGIHAAWLKCGPCPKRTVNAAGWSMCGACKCTASLEHQILVAHSQCHLPEPLWTREM